MGIRRKDNDCCGKDWIEAIRTLWSNYQSMIRSISYGSSKVTPDGNGNAAIDTLLEDIEINVDSELSDSSENAVQNKVIKAAIDATDLEVNSLNDRVESIEDDISTIESAVQTRVTDVVLGFDNNYNIDLAKYRNGSVYDDDIIPVDQTPASNVDALISSKAVYDALADKQDTLVSQTNIKSINGTSLLGSGGMTINEVPSTSGASSGQVLTYDGSSVGWVTPTGSGITITDMGTYYQIGY